MPTHPISEVGKQTLITAYSLTTIAILIILSRTLLRRLRREKFKLDDWLMLAAIPLYMMNTACYQVVIPNGNNLVKNPEKLGKQEIRERILGSKFALIGRPFYMSYIWMMKTCILVYYTRLTSRARELLAVKVCAVMIAVTYVAVFLSFFLECLPVNHYWQVFPKPAVQCTTAVGALITMGTCNIATDIFLMVIPLPLILRSTLPWKTKVKLVALFSLGVFVIMVSVMRIVIVLGNLTQVNKLLWGQLECFTATIVANGPVLHALWHHHGRSKRATTHGGYGYSSGSGSRAHDTRNASKGGTVLTSVAGVGRQSTVGDQFRLGGGKPGVGKIFGGDEYGSETELAETGRHKGLVIERTVELSQSTVDKADSASEISAEQNYHERFPMPADPRRKGSQSPVPHVS